MGVLGSFVKWSLGVGGPAGAKAANGVAAVQVLPKKLSRPVMTAQAPHYKAPRLYSGPMS